ncbi:hypothetical protein FSP39_011074 [Pinctada imbricata]|uniref:Uncharacterized protein n=1 Tax=Pinctada imbricata TaxID=66713 RepID=A0AA89CAG9_PINIB|nr:hypothetical protein FSP39_011074 [Pinctada imbricata]
MNQLYCICLNVKIIVRQRLYEADFTFRNELQEFNHDFFKQKIASIVDPDIQVEHSSLVHKTQLGDFVVHRCLNCGLDTHALSTKSSSGMGLVSIMLERDPRVIERLRQSSDFSKVFHIVLQDHGLDSDTLHGPVSGNQETVQTSLSTVQKRITDFLMQEEAAMEERVSQFEEEQRAQFQQLQSKVQLEKKKMISALLNTDRSDIGQSFGRDFQRGSVSPENKNRKPASPRKSQLSRTKSTPVRSFDADSDGMFLLDDEDTLTDQPFYVSDDEDEESNSDASPIPYPVSAHRKAKLTYSSSVPISVPTWGSMATRDAGDNDEEEPLPADLENIASSMQALARSIANDEREVFGDRPRPRLNTGDFKR